MKGRITLTGAAAMLEHQKSSGLSVQDFCRKEKLKLATYYYWHQRLRKIAEVPKIIPVSIEKPKQFSVSRQEVIELTYPNGVRLCVHAGFELNLIRQLVTIL
ncbi:MAG: hypothetical protein M0Q53_02480 [Prolixibacteraceae bacterium]|jgi:hypothetical protein|nr:hypothetical protein [Prolixibacteraceae bacterium]